MNLFNIKSIDINSTSIYFVYNTVNIRLGIFMPIILYYMREILLTILIPTVPSKIDYFYPRIMKQL